MCWLLFFLAAKNKTKQKPLNILQISEKSTIQQEWKHNEHPVLIWNFSAAAHLKKSHHHSSVFFFFLSYTFNGILIAFFSPAVMIQGWQRTACRDMRCRTAAGHIQCAPFCKTAGAQPVPGAPPGLRGTSTWENIHSWVGHIGCFLFTKR